MNIKFWVRFVAASLIVVLVFVLSFTYAYGNLQMEPYSDTEVVQRSSDNNKVTLVIDPGHGGEDGGAVSLTGAYESSINLSIALKAEQLAAFFGLPPVMTRTSEDIEYPTDATTIRAKKVADQKNRVALIESVENALLISIHQNKYTTSRPYGGQVFYAATDGSEIFGEYIQQRLFENTDAGNRKTAVKIPDSIYLMNAIDCPGILVECGFLSNNVEAQLLEQDDYQKRMALIIIGGTIGFLKESQLY